MKRIVIHYSEVKYLDKNSEVRILHNERSWRFLSLVKNGEIIFAKGKFNCNLCSKSVGIWSETGEQPEKVLAAFRQEYLHEVEHKMKEVKWIDPPKTSNRTC